MNQTQAPAPPRAVASKHQFPATYRPANERVQFLLSACAHYGRSDRPLFVAGYNELCRVDLNGGRILEVCCGYGQLAREMARAFPGAEVIALDRYPDAGRSITEAREKEGATNVHYRCGDALKLEGFADNSLDLIYGQATLHHLAHDTDSLRAEYSRVLKPGGRVVFIYEPLGHNPLWAMVRAYRIARAKMGDESNVVVRQLDEIARSFSGYEIQMFNFLGYPFKSLGRLAGESMMEFIFRMDAAVMKKWPSLAPMAANFNVVFTK